MPLGALPPTKRYEHRLPRCSWCALPLRLCVCDELPRLRTATSVVLLMHHVEQWRTSNTGRIAVRSLTRGRIVVRGSRDDAAREPLPEGRRLLLFPHGTAEPLTPAHAADGPVVLLVPDGSWSQAQRTARRDPDAQGATYVTLPEGGAASRYQLRKGPQAASLSTMEAIARALGVLEGATVEVALTAAFELFVERSMSLRSTSEAVEPEP